MKNALIMMALVLFASSCTTLKVVTDYDKTVDFTQYKTLEYYGWADESDKILNRFDKERIEAAFASEFSKRNLDLVKENGDLTVTLFIVTETKTKRTADTYTYGGYGSYYGYGPRWGYGGGHATTTISEYNYEVGTLVVSVYDKKKEQLIWEGVGSGTIDDNPTNKERNIPKVAAQIMKDFPIQPVIQ